MKPLHLLLLATLLFVVVFAVLLVKWVILPHVRQRAKQLSDEIYEENVQRFANRERIAEELKRKERLETVLRGVKERTNDHPNPPQP